MSKLFVRTAAAGLFMLTTALAACEADHFNNNLQMIEASTGNIFIIAGSGDAADKDSIGLNAAFNGPQGLCIDDSGNLYMTTFNYTTNGGNEVRKIVIR